MCYNNAINNKEGLLPMKKMSSGLEKAVDLVGEVLAFLTVALIVFLFANDAWHFIPAGNVVNILKSAREICILLVVGLAGLEFALKRGFVVFLIYAILVALAVIFLFFPGVLPINP